VRFEISNLGGIQNPFNAKQRFEPTLYCSDFIVPLLGFTSTLANKQFRLMDCLVRVRVVETASPITMAGSKLNPANRCDYNDEHCLKCFCLNGRRGEDLFYSVLLVLWAKQGEEGWQHIGNEAINGMNRPSPQHRPSYLQVECFVSTIRYDCGSKIVKCMVCILKIWYSCFR